MEIIYFNLATQFIMTIYILFVSNFSLHLTAPTVIMPHKSFLCKVLTLKINTQVMAYLEVLSQRQLF